MPTRTEIRQTAVAFYKASSSVSALVSGRVYDSQQKPYLGSLPHPALAVFTPGAESEPEDGCDAHWKTTERLMVQCFAKRETDETDATLSSAADTLERTVRAATLKSDALRRALDIDRIRSVRIERDAPDPSDAHRIVTFLTFDLEISEEFLGDGTDDVDLETLRINEHLVNQATGVVDDDPDVTADVDLT